jgi:hypothetical protein
MLHPHATEADDAAKYAEARRAWRLAREVALADWALAGADAQVARAPASETTVRPSHPDERGEMITFRSYGIARESIVSELLNDAAAHDAGRFDEIGRRAERMHLPRVGPPELTKLRVALSFWDKWTDARNRGWQAGGNIDRGEWPMLARRVASDLAADREISDARVRAHCDVRTRRSDG